MNLPRDLNRQIVHLDYLNEGNLEIHLQAIVNALTSFHGARNDFITVYPTFKKNRESCILLQKDMADSLDQHQFNCNMTTTASACVSMVGTIVGGAALIVTTGGLAAPAVIAAAPAVAVASGVSALAGGVTIMGTYVAKKVIEQKHVDKVNKLLECDKNYGEKLLKWIKRTDEVIAAIENVMDYDVFEQILKSLKINVEEYKSFKQKYNSEEIRENLNVCVENLSVSGEQKKILKELLSEIMANNQCLNLLLTISAVFYAVNPSIKQAHHAFAISVKAFRCLDASLDIGNTVFNIVRNSRRASKFLVAAGFLSAVNFAIDFYTLINVSKDILTGSKCELAKKIRICAKQLQQELDSLEIIHQGLIV